MLYTWITAHCQLEKTIGTGGGEKYQVICVKAKDSLICGNSTEFILRSGKALSKTTKQGGISDVTSGKDLKSDETVPLNHLIIVPRDDGRGLKAQTDCYVMIKGSYEIN
jgi:hypothetical protein